MSFIISLLILVLILGIIIFIHELGHFIAAKKSGVYVAEFALGMGPVIFKWKRKNKKDPTEYCIRAFPIGGYVAMANSVEEGYKIKKDQILENKSFIKKLLVLSMGIILNIILAILLLFFNGWLFGSPSTEAYIGGVSEESPAQKAGLEKGDMITHVDGKKTISWDEVLLEISVKDLREVYKLTVVKANGEKVELLISPTVEKEGKEEVRTFGIAGGVYKKEGFKEALKYSWNGLHSMVRSLFKILGNLFTGQVPINNLSGPVGIFQVVDNIKMNSDNIERFIYLTAYLSMNVAIINLLPIPVFDGGRILLLMIEAARRKKTSPKVENWLNIIGFGLMILLMIVVTISDIFKIF